MAKVITFSRYYPTMHPRKYERTHFVEKIHKALNLRFNNISIIQKIGSYNNYSDLMLPEYQEFFKEYSYADYQPKIHTMRAGKRWKTGDKASLRIWSEKPYRSKQIIIAPEITIPRVADIEIDEVGFCQLDGLDVKTPEVMSALIANDGLNRKDFESWFEKSLPFSGQLIFLTDTKTPY